MTTNEDYRWWQSALRGSIPDMVEDDPQPGYYRIKNSAGGWDPLAIWRAEDGILAQRGPEEGGQEVDPLDVWTWCCKYPIPYQTYVTVARNGEPWPFEIPREAVAGDNAAPAHEVIGDRLTAIRTQADLWLQSIGGALRNQDDADKAAAFTEQIAKLQKEADQTFTNEKQPWLEGGRLVDSRWRNVREACAVNLRWLKDLAGAWMIQERKAREEAARKANEEAGASGAPAVQAAPVRAGARGATRAVTLRKVKRVKLHDLAKVAAHIAALPNPPADFAEVCSKIAARLLTAGVEVPGAEMIEEEVAA